VAPADENGGRNQNVGKGQRIRDEPRHGERRLGKGELHRHVFKVGRKRQVSKKPEGEKRGRKDTDSQT